MAQSGAWANSRYTILSPLEGLKTECMLQDKYDFMWLGTYMGLYRYDGYSAQLLNTSPREGMQLSDKVILSLFEDRDTNLWIGTENGINCLNSSRTRLTQYLVEKDFYQNGKNTISAITQDHNGTIWCGSQKGIVFALTDNKEFRRIPNPLKSYPDQLFSPVSKIVVDKAGHLWIATAYRGVYKMNTAGEILKHFPTENLKAFRLNENGEKPVIVKGNDLFIYDSTFGEFVPALTGHNQEKPWLDRTLLFKDEQYIWFSHDFKLFRWHIPTGALEDFSATYIGIEQLVVYAMYQDPHRNYWLSTASGVIKISHQENCFTTIAPPNITKEDYFSTRAIVEGGKDTLYIGSYKGFFEYNLQKQSFKEYRYKKDKQWINPVIRAIIKDSTGNLWLGSESFGLFHFNTRTHKFTPVKVSNTYENHPNPDLGSARYICSMLKDHKNRLWVGTYNGLFILDRPNGELQPYVHGINRVNLHTLNIRAIHESQDYSIWLATNGGLFKITADQGITAHYTSDTTSGKTRLSNNYVNCIYEDSEGYLWLGTKGGGINKLHPDKGVTEIYTTHHGLANDEVYAIVPAENNKLWITTLNGLSSLDLTKKSFRNFYTKDGLPGNEFNQGSALAGTDGRLYLGGIKGIVSFLPNDMVKEALKPQIKLTKLVKHNGVSNQTEEISLSIHSIKDISLHHKDKFFTIYFAIANNFENAKCHFAYKLEGISNDWQYIGSSNFIQFTSLPAGNYVLYVKGAGNDGVWVSEPLHISIQVGQAFYTTFWAYLFYACVLAVIVFLIVRFQWKRIKLQNQLNLEHLQRQKLLEIDRMKSQFFTNIAHEFRTPLTLILGPAERMLSETTEAKYKNLVGTIRRNSLQMLDLIDQLLDLSKLESGVEKLELTYQDIVFFIRDTTYAIQSLADQHTIQLSFHTDLPELKTAFDPVKLQKILYNLLSNACKFTPAAGSITVSVKLINLAASEKHGSYVEITVADTGIGMEKEHLPFIFDRYYQIPDSRKRGYRGTGIGLCIVKELVELHQGNVRVDSEPGIGTRFVINLPVSCSALPLKGKLTIKDTAQYNVLQLLRQTDNKLPAEIPAPPVENDLEKQVILVAEDHEGVRQFICESLAPYYSIIETSNGVEGLKKAKESIPDIIISDVMMPQMDGHTLLHFLKDDEHTSHIPVILLTAKSSQESRIEGLKTGADLYLTKPFDVQELLLSIRNLLYLRGQIHKQLAVHPLPATNPSLSNPVDQSFLDRFTSIVDKHLSDDSFGVEEMGIQIGMSRTQLHRKVKAVTGESTSHLIRTIRLQRAVEMLKNNSLSITEIAYQVGFSSPSYFTESFTKHFGHPPTVDRRVKA